MKIGFAKNDITPRVGVELCGFGPFMCRHSIGIRDRLWARAMAVEVDGQKVIVISCDLVGTQPSIANRARQLVTEATGVPGDAIMLHSTHTHSGPNTGAYIGWGAPDEPYIETVPQRIAKPAIDAAANMCEATLSHAETPCEGIGQNREYDRDALPLEEVLPDDWRPDRPELTDTTCHVIRVESEGRMIGFLSYFGCHPVVCGSPTRYIHGDYCGVATNLLERENPGSVGLFLQGAHGDVNTCAVHKPEQDALLALDVIAARYANAVRGGLGQTTPVDVDVVRHASHDVVFSRKGWDTQKLKALLAEKEAVIHAPDATDEPRNVRMDVVHAIALRRLIEKKQRGDSLSPPLEIHGIRIGPFVLLGSPFEVFQAIKNEVKDQAKSPIPLVMGVTNDTVGYAPDHTAAARGGYAADIVPIMCGSLPYANIHDELVQALLALDGDLCEAE